MGTFSLPESYQQEARTADTRFLALRGQCNRRQCEYSARTYIIAEEGCMRYCGNHSPDVVGNRRIDVAGTGHDTCDSVMAVEDRSDPDKPGGIVHESCSYRPFAAIFSGGEMELRCKLHLPGRWDAHLRG